MKALLFSMVFTFSIQAFADQCQKVAYSCLTEEALTTQVNAFMTKEIQLGGEIYDLHHVNVLKLYSGNLLHNFDPKTAREESLLDLATWATKTLGKYDYTLTTPLEMVQGAEKMSQTKLRQFLNGLFMDGKGFLAEYDISNLTLQQKKEIASHAATKSKVIAKILDLVSVKGKEVTVYALLDNDNENVADAQWVIVGEKKILVINKYWQL